MAFNMDPKKCPMPTQDPNVRNKNFEEVALGYTKEMAVNEAKRCIHCKNKPCQTGCPVGIDIPSCFSCFNSKRMFGRPQSSERYAELTKNGSGPNDCIGCGQCEEACPQHLKVRELLREVVAEFGEG